MLNPLTEFGRPVDVHKTSKTAKKTERNLTPSPHFFCIFLLRKQPQAPNFSLFDLKVDIGSEYNIRHPLKRHSRVLGITKWILNVPPSLPIQCSSLLFPTKIRHKLLNISHLKVISPSNIYFSYLNG